MLEICTDCVARQCAEGEGATNCTFRSAGQYQDAVGSTNCTLSLRQKCTRTPLGNPSARCGIVVNVSHLYEYLAVTEDHVTGDFALTGAAACCFGGTRTNDSHANSSTVCADHR